MFTIEGYFFVCAEFVYLSFCEVLINSFNLISKFKHVDDFEDEDLEEDNEEGDDHFMSSYTDALNKQLKGTTLDRSFVRANDQPLKKPEVYFLFNLS